MKEGAPSLRSYLGVDLVDDLIAINTATYGTPTIQFRCLDLTNPTTHAGLRDTDAELIMCLDVFGHLVNAEVSVLLDFIFTTSRTRFFLVTNRRDDKSLQYLTREKSRHEGIDLERHPIFLRHVPTKLSSRKAEFPNDWFDLYQLR